MASDLRTAAEDWRQKSGAISIDKFEWRAADASLTIDGAVVLDETHRPAGRLTLVAKGAGPILVQLGVPAGVAQAQNLIGALLGKPAAAKAEGADTLTLPLILAKGQVFLGPHPPARGLGAVVLIRSGKQKSFGVTADPWWRRPAPV